MNTSTDEFQFHRPLVACTLIGAVLGDMKTGIIIGGTLEIPVFISPRTAPISVQATRGRWN
jgi:mannose/fructose/N-acetylgalactosamine-specific phosphotransferase system component IIC